jgi:hypothetical protein
MSLKAVLLDPVSRKTCLDTLVEMAKHMSHCQFIFYHSREKLSSKENSDKLVTRSHQDRFSHNLAAQLCPFLSQSFCYSEAGMPSVVKAE